MARNTTFALFGETISRMDPNVQKNEKMKELAQGLEKIQGLMEESGEVVGADVVVEIQRVCSSLLDSIGTKGKS